MKTIFGFIGSPLRQRSNTYTLTKMMLDKLVEMDETIEYELLTAGDVNIRHCKGCWSCMTRGRCPQDKKDDMGLLKQKMIKADFIILGSPVYTMQVSGQMKTFLDRLAAWYHILKLAGKNGMTTVTTAGSGMDLVQDYLGMMLGNMGVKVVGTLETYGTFPGTLVDPGKASKDAEEKANLIYPYLTDEINIGSDEFLEQVFQVMKHKVMIGKEWLPADYEYWEKNGMLDLNTFEELLQKINK